MNSGLAVRMRPSVVAICLFLIIGLYPQSAAAQYYDEIDMVHDALDELEGWHAYQPIFNGLKYRSGPWEKRITSGYGVRIFDKEMVTTSLSLVISTKYDPLRKNFASAAEIAELCQTEAAVSEKYSSPHIRLIGLCALDRCSRYSPTDWKTISGSLMRKARNHKLRDKKSVIVASDAVFMARVANQCGFADSTHDLLNLSKPLIESAQSIYSRCESTKCEVQDTNFAYSVFPLAAGVFMAQIDIANISNELLQLTRAYWKFRNYDISDIKDDRVDHNISELCESALRPAESCRTAFKYSFFLERHFLDRMSKLTDESNISEAIAVFRQEFEEEFHIRSFQQ